MTETDLPGMQERLYCNAETATTSGTEIRLTEARCDEARREEDISEFLSGDFPTCGCFRKKGRAYCGRGGSRAEVASKELPGVQERIYCRGDGRRFFLFRAEALVESETAASYGASFGSLGLAIAAVSAAFSFVYSEPGGLPTLWRTPKM